MSKSTIVLQSGFKKPKLVTQWQGAKILPTALVFGLGLVFWMTAPPEGLDLQSWHLLIIFLGTIIAVILNPLPLGAISMIATTLCVATNTLSIDQAMTSFSSSLVWLIVLAFFLALGFKRTGLGTRIAYFFISHLGKSTLGLSYGFVLTELFLAPFIPSNTARGAGIIFPVVSSLAQEQGSCPKKGTQRAVGAFLLMVSFQVNMVTSAMFLTGLVGNPLIASFAKSFGIQITWMSWAVAALVPGLVNLTLIPLALYKFYPPKVRYSPESKEAARQKLQDLGSLRSDEIMMIITFAGVLFLWIFGGQYGINPTTAALIGFSALLLTGVLRWQDCMKEIGAWEALMWFAPLLMMAGYLTEFGLMQWFSGRIQGLVHSFSWPITFITLSIVYFYTHYLFASVTARATALYSVFLTVMLSAGTPPMLAGMALAVLSALAGSLTHFGTGTAPIYFGAGYIKMAEWWRVSLIISILNLVTWTVVGGVWWKVLGYW